MSSSPKRGREKKECVHASPAGPMYFGPVIFIHWIPDQVWNDNIKFHSPLNYYSHGSAASMQIRKPRPSGTAVCTPIASFLGKQGVSEGCRRISRCEAIIHLRDSGSTLPGLRQGGESAEDYQTARWGPFGWLSNEWSPSLIVPPFATLPQT